MFENFYRVLGVRVEVIVKVNVVCQLDNFTDRVNMKLSRFSANSKLKSYVWKVNARIKIKTNLNMTWIWKQSWLQVT